MSPESINFRRFTTASDVWMFGEGFDLLAFPVWYFAGSFLLLSYDWDENSFQVKLTAKKFYWYSWMEEIRLFSSLLFFFLVLSRRTSTLLRLWGEFKRITTMVHVKGAAVDASVIQIFEMQNKFQTFQTFVWKTTLSESWLFFVWNLFPIYLNKRIFFF